jgi:hypothetical protein
MFFTKSRGTVLKKDTTRQALEFGASVLKQLPRLPPEDMQYWIKKQGQLQEVLARALAISAPRLEWEKFYQEIFGIKIDLSSITLPEKQDGFERLLIMAVGLTPNRLFDKCEERFQSWRSTDNLDAFIESARTAKRTYAIWLRDRIEADDENQNLSANECGKLGIIGITLEERFLLELFYNWRTNKHLDVNNYTLCAGSRTSMDDVPIVHWNRSDGRMVLDRYGLGTSCESLRVRSVSL